MACLRSENTLFILSCIKLEQLLVYQLYKGDAGIKRLRLNLQKFRRFLKISLLVDLITSIGSRSPLNLDFFKTYPQMATFYEFFHGLLNHSFLQLAYKCIDFLPRSTLLPFLNNHNHKWKIQDALTAKNYNYFVHVGFL